MLGITPEPVLGGEWRKCVVERHWSALTWDNNMLQKAVDFLIVADGKEDMPGCDALFLFAT